MNRGATVAILVTLLFSLSLCRCGEKTGPEEDLTSKSLMGKWTAYRKADENGVKVVEAFSLFFWDQGGQNRYRWIYTITYDGVEDEKKSIEEEGNWSATDSEITFDSDGGESSTLSYEYLKDDPQYDLRVVDKQGAEWNMIYFVWFGHKP